MPPHLVTPLQTLLRWLDERPAVRLLATLALVGVAVFATLPGWVLDLWLVCSLTAAIGTATLLVAFGPELSPREVLTGLPSTMRRSFFHRMALAIALTKAILTGHNPGVLMEWLAHGGLAGSVGVGLAVVAALYVAQLGFGAFFAQEAGATSQELVDTARQIFALIRRHAALGLALAVALLAAGLVTGLLVKQWPLSLTFTSLTLYGLAEACFTAAPGLVLGGAMAFWLTQILEAHDEEPVEEAPAAPAVVTLEVGKELAGSLRRAVPLQVAVLRTRLAEELGLPLPRVATAVAPTLPARMARVSIHGLPEQFIELAEFESLEAIAQLLESVCRQRAEALLTVDATGALLDELQAQAPVVVRQALEKLGLPTIHGVLKGLLREQVPIRDLAGLLEALLLVAGPEPGAAVLVEHARRSQAHAIGLKLADDHGTITAVELGSGWDEVLAGFTSWDTGLAADWSAGRSLAEAVRSATAKAIEAGLRPVLLVPRRYRPLVADALRAHGLSLAVLAPDEVSARFNLRLAGSIPRPADALVR